jgi:hypothetical protein
MSQGSQSTDVDCDSQKPLTPQELQQLGTVLFGIVPGRLSCDIERYIETQTNPRDGRFRTGLESIILRCLRDEIESLWPSIPSAFDSYDQPPSENLPRLEQGVNQPSSNTESSEAGSSSKNSLEAAPESSSSDLSAEEHNTSFEPNSLTSSSFSASSFWNEGHSDCLIPMPSTFEFVPLSLESFTSPQYSATVDLLDGAFYDNLNPNMHGEGVSDYKRGYE